MRGFWTRFLLCVGILCLTFLLVGGALVFITVVNLSSIDLSIDGAALQQVVNESTRYVLRDGEAEQQLDALKMLQEGVRNEPDTSTWIEAEFREEIQQLSYETDTEIGSTAITLLRSLDEPTIPAP